MFAKLLLPTSADTDKVRRHADMNRLALKDVQCGQQLSRNNNMHYNTMQLHFDIALKKFTWPCDTTSRSIVSEGLPQGHYADEVWTGLSAANPHNG